MFDKAAESSEEEYDEALVGALLASLAERREACAARRPVYLRDFATEIRGDDTVMLTKKVAGDCESGVSVIKFCSGFCLWQPLVIQLCHSDNLVIS